MKARAFTRIVCMVLATALIGAGLITSFATMANAASYSTGIYKTQVDSGSYLNMRSGAGTGYSTVTTVPNNTELTVTKVSQSGGYSWGYTSYNGRSGWVALEFCKLYSAFSDRDDLDTPKINSYENTTQGVKLSWKRVEGAALYRVFYKSASGTWKGMGNTSSTYFVDDDVRSGHTYTYTVRCVSADGSKFTSGYDNTGFRATFIGTPVIKSAVSVNNGVEISWEIVEGAYQYRVFYKSASGTWKGMGNTDKTYFTDTVVSSGSTYTYTVRCLDKYGDYVSGYNSTGFKGTYLDVPKVTEINSLYSGVEINWNRVPGAAMYRVFYKSASGVWRGMGNTASTSFVDEDVSTNHTYTYTVRCISSDGSKFTSGYNNSGWTHKYVRPAGGYIKLNTSSETIYTGNKLALNAKASGRVSWKSSNTSVASVDSNGVVTANSSGSATITASCDGESATCRITVRSGYSVHISSTRITDMRRGKSVLLRSNTGGVSWKSSNPEIAVVSNGIVDTKSTGWVTITAYTSGGAATCLINVIGRDNIRFAYANPNSAPKNSKVYFKAITDTDRSDVRFVVSKGTESFTVYADEKIKDGDTYVWYANKVMTSSGLWNVKAYSKYVSSSEYLTTPGNGECDLLVTNSTDKKTTVTGDRRASDEVIDIIADYEGYLSSVTADVITSDPTLGYGKVVTTNEQFYNNLTKREAYAYLCQTVNNGGYTTKTNAFLNNNGVKFNQQQFDALVCFAYNVGASAISNDSLLQNVLLDTGSGASVTSGGSGYVNGSSVNLRSGAGTGYSIITCMDLGTKFTFVDGKTYNSEWYKIKLSNGTVGYIYKTYASASGGSRDLNNTSKSAFIKNFLQYHHASGCQWGLLYRRVDEAEIFFYGDYSRDGRSNKYGFSFTCSKNSSFYI
ncbi:MAG: SH3 domain-containing protein [Ruminococcus sp.]|nr:SH3 domain-containing protein [Ruminococcus sp.]